MGALDIVVVVANVASVLSIIGFGVSLFTLLKVSSVAKAQAQERSLTQELLGVDQIEQDLRRMIAKLGELDDRSSTQLATDLSIRLGAIQGVRQAMSATPRSPDSANVRVDLGFFGDEFVLNLIQRAKTNIDIVTGRTFLVSGFYTLDKLRQACERGVVVRVIGMSKDADEIILNDAIRTVSNPAPRDAAEYRRQIENNQRDIIDAVSSWTDPRVRARFQYRTDANVPRISMARVDATVNLGFLQFYRDAQPREIKDRAYLQFSVNSAVGTVAMKHFEIAWNNGSQCLPAPTPGPTPTPP